MVWKVVVCRSCGHYQLTRARNSFKCFKCGHTARIDSGSVVFSSQDPSEAREYLLRIKMGTS